MIYKQKVLKLVFSKPIDFIVQKNYLLIINY